VPWTLPDDAVLGIFAKHPVPGRVKTRLAGRLGADGAAEAHAAMLLDGLDLWGGGRYLAPGGRRVVVFSPRDSAPWFDAHTPPAFALQHQEGPDLGARMANFMTAELAEGAGRVVLIGSDSPTLDPSHVVSAFLCLEHKDVVLGPAADGGYYLVGARVPVPELFRDIPWSTPQVLARSVAALRDAGRSLAVLPPWYDVDTPESWDLLAGHVAALRLAGLDPELPRTEALLARQEG
jgi:rSAM/selenodomain-associated transferase 1